MNEAPMRRGPSGLSASLAARVLGASFLWGTAAGVTWVIVVVIVGGGFATVNLIVVGFGLWGAVLGCTAGGVHIFTSFALGRVVPRLPRDLIAATLGWGVPLVLWCLLVFGSADVTVEIVSTGVAALGAMLNFAVVRLASGV